MAKPWDYAVVSFLSSRGLPETSAHQGSQETWLMASPLGTRTLPTVERGLNMMGSHGWKLVNVIASGFVQVKNADGLTAWMPQQYDAYFKKRRTSSQQEGTD